MNQHNADNFTVEMPLVIEEEWPGKPQRPVPIYCYTLLTAFLSFTTVCSLTLNATVVIITLKSRKLRKPINLIMVNLSLSDFLSALIGGPISIMANAKGYFFFNKFVCVTDGFLVGVLGVTNLITIVVLSVSRYLIIFYQSSFIFSAQHAKIGIAIAWTWSLIWHIPPLFWDGYDLEGIGTSCAPNYKYNSEIGLVFMVTYFMFCFLLPLLVMSTSYALLIRFLRRTQNSAVHHDIRKKNEHRSLKMVIIVVIAFLVCWSPYATVSMYTVISNNTELDMYITTFPAYFAKSAGIYNPIIYFLMNRRFRKEVLNTISQQSFGSRTSERISEMSSTTTN